MAGRKGASGSGTAAREPDGGEVRTESWAAVEAGCGVWARNTGGAWRVGGARRAGQRRRLELCGELAGGGRREEGIRSRGYSTLDPDDFSTSFSLSLEIR